MKCLLVSAQMCGTKFVSLSSLHIFVTFDNHVQNIIYRISADISDIDIFLLPIISSSRKNLT